MNIMQPYIDLGKSILEDSNNCSDRTGAGTWSIFGHLLEFNVRKGAPFLTERKLPLRSVAGELLWFLEGSVNVDVLRDDYRCSFWEEWASDKTRTIGPMYGEQWRNARGVDQLANIIQAAIDTPDSRRLVVSTWIPDLIPDETMEPKLNPDNNIMALAPCHYAYQIRLYDDEVYEDSKHNTKVVDLMFNLRSSDYFLGLPNNIASYYMLQVMICRYLSVKTGIHHSPRKLKVCLGDVHIYKNHVEACEELFKRNPSTVVPKFDIPYTVLKYYLNNHLNGEDNKTEMRQSLLKQVHTGVSDYKPGTTITGARNV